jgi:putative nucleotidyltransferase with HDIG domain
MKIDTRLFRSILARRFFLLFIISALVPIVILSVVAYWKVSDEALKLSTRRLGHTASSLKISVSERLHFLDTEFSLAAQAVGPAGFATPVGRIGERLYEMFDGLLVASTDGETSTVFGEASEVPEFDKQQRDHLESGKTLLLSIGGETSETPSVAMVRMVDPIHQENGLVMGVVSPDYLWGIADHQNVVPYGIDQCAYDDARRLLYGSFEGCREITPLVVDTTVGTHRGDLELRIDGEDFLAHFLNLFLNPQFHADTWSFVLIQSEVEVLSLRDSVFDLSGNFLKVFPLVVLVCFWVVLLLSSFAIRQSLVPLDRLTEGTKRIAERDFSTRVEVDSGDEFDDLAEAFNTMSDRLQRQFRALATNAEIQRAILSTIETTTIVETAAAGALDTIDSELVCVGVRGAGDSGEAVLYYASKGNVEAVSGVTSNLSNWDIEALSGGVESVVLSDGAGKSELLASLPAGSDSIVVAFPVMLGARLAAVLCIGRIGERPFSVEELDQGRQLADQVAVALSNSNLIEELKALMYGTLEALSRAIDAKSPWTAGHSGRVTAMSLKIASVLGRSRRELDVMHRGALLHDIGKLGVAVTVLDKPGLLETDERQHLMEHPSIGGRILDPISAFADIIPIITGHHERFDGMGYPNGLAGDEIHINARILAVADAYDAMTSDRPYRKGRSPEVAIEEIRSQAGTQFDPKVVDAFLIAVGRDPENTIVPPDLDQLDDVAGRSA